MKKRLLLIALIALLSGMLTLAAEEEDKTAIELGIGLAPVQVSEEDSTMVNKDDVFGNSLKMFHIGYKFAAVLYASVDTFIVPPVLTMKWSAPYIEDPITHDFIAGVGVARPSMLNMIDFGLEFKIASIVFSAQAGINSLYIYKQDQLNQDVNTNLGANLKLSAGFKLNNNLGVSVNAFSVQPSFDAATKVIKMIFSDESAIQRQGLQKLTETLVWSAMVVLYL